MISEPARLSGISLDFAGIPPSEMKIFHMNMREWASRQSRIEFSLINFVLFFIC